MKTFTEWLKNVNQFEDAEYAAKKLVKAGVDPMSNVSDILDAMEIMDVKPLDGTTPELFAARIKQILRGNVSKSDFVIGHRPIVIRF